MQSKNYIRILSIAGSDSGGGAGVQADLKTIAALGCYGMTAITAITAQNTVGVTGIHAVPPDMLAAQIKAVVTDIGVDAVKIGMLHSLEAVNVVADAIKTHKLNRVVLDPVMISSSGHSLMTSEAVSALTANLAPLASLITPNLDEAAALLGRQLESVSQIEVAVRDLHDLVTCPVLIKGGHLSGNEAVDVLLDEQGDVHRFSSPRIISRNTHGTGCTLSSAIACYLSMGLPLVDAVAKARSYILQAIAAGSDIKIGAGHGPLNHGFAPVATRAV